MPWEPAPSDTARRLPLMEGNDLQFVAFGVGHGPTVRSVLGGDPSASGHRRVDTASSTAVWHEEGEMDAVAMLPPLRFRFVHPLEEQDRIEPARINDVGHELPWVVLVAECGGPKGAYRRDVD